MLGLCNPADTDIRSICGGEDTGWSLQRATEDPHDADAQGTGARARIHSRELHTFETLLLDPGGQEVPDHGYRVSAWPEV